MHVEIAPRIGFAQPVEFTAEITRRVAEHAHRLAERGADLRQPARAEQQKCESQDQKEFGAADVPHVFTFIEAGAILAPRAAQCPSLRFRASRRHRHSRDPARR